MTSRSVYARSVNPLHPATDPAKLADLTVALANAGWSGRPLLVIPRGDGWQALTGSHRLTAARAARIEYIPILAVEAHDLTAEQWDEMDGIACLDDDDKITRLSDLGLTEAAELMAAEIAANEAV